MTLLNIAQYEHRSRTRRAKCGFTNSLNNKNFTSISYSRVPPHKPLGIGAPAHKYLADDNEIYITGSCFTLISDDKEKNQKIPPLQELNRTSQDVFTDYARFVREHIENWIDENVIPGAWILNHSPKIKWMVTYRD